MTQRGRQEAVASCCPFYAVAEKLAYDKDLRLVECARYGQPVRVGVAADFGKCRYNVKASEGLRRLLGV